MLVVDFEVGLLLLFNWILAATGTQSIDQVLSCLVVGRSATWLLKVDSCGADYIVNASVS